MNKTLISVLIIAFNLSAFAQSIFTQSDSIKIQITAPFQQLFAKKEVPNPIMSVMKESVEGTLSVVNPLTKETEIYDVTLKMRGNHSLGVCQFPKLKIKFTKEQTAKNRYFNKKSYDIATHCMNDVSAFSEYSTEKMYLASSPHREKFVYDLQEELGFVSPRTQNAIIDYVDNSDVNQLVSYSNKDAFLIESTSSMIKRLGAQYEVIGVKGFSKKASLAIMTGVEDDDLPQKLFMNVKDSSQIDVQEVIKLHLLNLLVGNFDFFVQTDENDASGYGTLGLKNVKCVAVAEDSWKLFTNDFNLAMMLANKDQTEFQYAEAMLNAMKSVIEEKVTNRIKLVGTSQDLSDVARIFIEKKVDLYNKATLLNDDPLFQKNYKLYLDIFYKQINELIESN